MFGQTESTVHFFTTENLILNNTGKYTKATKQYQVLEISFQ
jgi:hypothetical protein